MQASDKYDEILAEEVSEFFITEGDGLFIPDDKSDLALAILGHIRYGTLKVFRDSQGIAAALRWNWVGENEVYVLDAAVRSDLRGVGMIKKAAQACLRENPGCLSVTYHEREMKKFIKTKSKHWTKEFAKC